MTKPGVLTFLSCGCVARYSPQPAAADTILCAWDHGPVRKLTLKRWRRTRRSIQGETEFWAVRMQTGSEYFAGCWECEDTVVGSLYVVRKHYRTHHLLRNCTKNRDYYLTGDGK